MLTRGRVMAALVMAAGLLLVVPAPALQEAVQSLHSAFGLDSGVDYGAPLPERK